MDTPFFIVGASRSGTTMLRLMLNAHSRLAVPDEMKYFRHVEGQYDLAAWRRPLREEEYRTLAQRYLNTRENVLAGAKAALTAVLAENDRTIRGPYRALLAHWAQTRGKERWGEKTPHNIFYVDVLADMFPDAQFIHVVRDPRAVVQSMNASSYYSGETVFNALNWRKSIRDGEALFQDHLRPEQHLTVRYEDLVRQPESTVRSVCEFLDEPFESRMFRFYETADQDMAHEIRTPSIKGPVNRRGLSKWRKRLSPFEVSIVERLCREEMHNYGYECEGDTGGLRLWMVLKMVYWQWKVWQHRRKRGFEVEFSFLSGVRTRVRSCMKKTPTNHRMLKTKFKNSLKGTVGAKIESFLAALIDKLSRLKISASSDPGSGVGRRKDLFEKMIPEGACGAEIGVHKGKLSAWILKENGPKELHLIDPWWRQDPSNWAWSRGDKSPARSAATILAGFAPEIERGIVKVHPGYDLDVLKTFPNEYFDWVYLDTTHQYEDTVRELDMLINKVKVGGVITGDDWYPDEDHHHHGVCKAVREVLEERSNLSLAYCRYHQWAIRLKAETEAVRASQTLNYEKTDEATEEISEPAGQ